MNDSRGSREVDIRRNRMYREMARLMTNIMSAQSLVDEQDFQVSLAQAGKESSSASPLPSGSSVRWNS